MPRPREFDTDAALDAALDTFWRLGYGATRVADLTDAMGLSRPSLYNAFGDKRALFLAALDRYAEGYRALAAGMDAEPDGKEAVASALRGVARAFAAPAGPAGCLRVGTTAACGPDDPELVAALAVEQRAMEAAFEDRLTRAQTDGQLAPEADVAVLAAFFVGAISAMAVRARVAPDEDVLVGMAETAVSAWPDP